MSRAFSVEAKGRKETLLLQSPDESNFYATVALCKILKNPRPHHLKYLSGLDKSQLQDKETVRQALLDKLEWSKRITPARTVIFGHLWRNIAQYIGRQTGAKWNAAYPTLVPKVS
jgi:hypothetical protein